MYVGPMKPFLWHILLYFTNLVDATVMILMEAICTYVLHNAIPSYTS